MQLSFSVIFVLRNHFGQIVTNRLTPASKSHSTFEIRLVIEAHETPDTLSVDIIYT